jgi:Fe2+ transport system protein B
MQSQSPSPSRKELEQELTAFARHISEKSDSDAAATLLALYQKFKLAEMESEVRSQLDRVEESMRFALEARLNALTSEIETPEVTVEAVEEEVTLPAEALPIQADESTPPEAVQLEIPAASEEEIELHSEISDVPEDLEAIKLVVKEDVSKQQESPGPTANLSLDATAGIERTKVVPLDEAPLPKKEAPEATDNSTLSERAQQSSESTSLNDRFAQKVLKFGLNDRIGFVKALFEGNQEDFNRVVSQLNTLHSLSEAHEFIETYVAPEYKWDQQEEMAERFMTAVATKFN